MCMKHGTQQSIQTDIAEAIYTINRHAKTAPNPKYLYQLKKQAIEKLLKEKKAEKVGIHYSPNPKFSQQQLDVLVKVANYYFHIPPKKEDVRSLPHLGKQSTTYRNPKVNLPLKKAIARIESFLGVKLQKKVTERKRPNNKPVSNFSDHLFLGKK
jgi:hypothetical protein